MSTSQTEVINQVYSLVDKKDEELSSLLNSIDSDTACLSSDEIPLHKKYEVIVGIEYKLVRARLLVETEHISVKKIMSGPDITPVLKAVFSRRDQYLAQVCLKLTSIREDIANLQKVVYTASNFLRK